MHFLFTRALILAILFITFSGIAVSQTAATFAQDGHQFLRDKKYEQAVEAFRASLRLAPDNAQTQTSLGVALALFGRHDEALIPFREAVRLSPAAYEIRFNLCMGLTRTRNHDEALTHCREAARLSPESVRAVAMISTNLRALNRMEEALSILSAAIQKFGNDIGLLQISAEISLDSGDFISAVSKYQILAGLEPNNASYHAALANCYLRLEKDRQAVESATKALEIDPRNGFAHFYLGKVHFELGQNEEAFAALKRSSELAPKFAETFHYLGLVQERLGKIDDSISSLRSAVNLDSNSYYYYLLGKLLCTAARYQEAVAPLRKAEELEPNNVGIKTQLGLAFFESANFEEALETLAEADRLKPNQPNVKMFLQMTNARKNNRDNLERLIARVKENPDNSKFKLDLAQTYGHLRKFNEAEALYLEVIKLQPNDGQIHNLLGVFYTAYGQSEKAANAYRKAGELTKHHVPYLSLAMSMDKLGRTADSLEAYKKAYEIKPDSTAVLKLYADALTAAGKRQEAISLYRNLLSIEPSNVAALGSLGYVYIKVNDKEGAKRIYEAMRIIDPSEAKRFARCLRYHAFL